MNRLLILVVTALAAAFLLPGCGKGQAARSDDLTALQQTAVQRLAARQDSDAGGQGQWHSSQRPAAGARSLFSATGADPAGAAADRRVASGEPAQLVLSAPAGSPVPPPPSAPSPGGAAPAESAQPAGKPAAGEHWWQEPLAGRSFGEVVKSDLKLFPREFWKSAKDSVNVPSLIVIGLAGGLTPVSHVHWDRRTDHFFRAHRDTLWDHEGDFGSVAGNPLLHTGLALAIYGFSVQTKNDGLYGYSKSLMQALVLTDMTTMAFKLTACNHSPNGEALAWPSGHTSSTAALAAVTWEYYGWPAGVPLYMLTGWVAVSRLNDREHWLSDVIFGAALGSCIGHSVARGRMIEVGGFTVLPYVPAGGGAGLMLTREF